MAEAVLLDLLGLLPRLKLLLLLDFLLQHLLEAFVILGLAEHPRPLLGPDIPFELVLLLLLAKTYPIGYKFQFIFELAPSLSELGQLDGL